MIAQVHVKTRKGQNKVRRVSVKPLAFEVDTTEIPDKGKANSSVIKQIAQFLSVPPTTVHIVKGFTSSNKIVEISSDTFHETV